MPNKNQVQLHNLEHLLEKANQLLQGKPAKLDTSLARLFCAVSDSFITCRANLVLFSRKGDETEEKSVTSFLKNTIVINIQLKRDELFSGSSRDNPKDLDSFICIQMKITSAAAAGDDGD